MGGFFASAVFAAVAFIIFLTTMYGPRIAAFIPDTKLVRG
jgi:hypothetical protein